MRTTGLTMSKDVHVVATDERAVGTPGFDPLEVRESRTRKLRTLLPLAPAVVYLLLLYAAPLFGMALLSFGSPDFTPEHYQRFATSESHLYVFYRTFLISLLATLSCLALGYPVAYQLTRVGRRARNLLLIGVLAPWIISTLVRTFAWMLLLGRRGPINETLLALGVIGEPLALLGTSTAVYIGLVYVHLPLAILPMFSVMLGIDPKYVRVAQSSGARPLQAFRHVYFPLSLPGVAGAGLLLFIGNLGFYITPLLLGGPGDLFIANLIDVQIQSLLNWPYASALGFILLGLTFLAFLVYNRYLELDKVMGGSTS